MAIVSFTLSEDGVVAFQNALACILKFSDDVSLEARRDKLVLTALNLSQSAYLCFSFAADRFFSRYNFEGSAQYRDRFFCVLYIRALLSVFRSRIGGDPSRDRDRETSIDRCDVIIDDGPGKKSRFIARIVCRNGITATHGLPFEVKAPTHAKFNQDEAVNHWGISSRTLRQLMEHFGPKIELLDINPDGDNVMNFACFTEKQYVKAEDFLNKPLHTTIAVDMAEFDDVQVQDKLHIIISVKDFRAILHHAGITSGQLSVRYSTPGRPMKLSYAGDGLLCDFILMTVGEKGTIGHQAKRSRAKAATKDAPRGLEAAAPARGDMQPPPPPKAAQTTKDKPTSAPFGSQFQMRPPAVPPSTLRSESLFVPQDEDNEWEPVNPDEQDGEGEQSRLEWDASYQPNPSALRISNHYDTPSQPQQEPTGSSSAGLEPTQRLSEVRKFGLFSR